VVALGRERLGHPPTYFEALTVAAYSHFAAQAIDVAVMEIGLGGRLDATNAADPVLSVITTIARDHTKVLGSTLDRIAREKAGILRAGRTALHGAEPAVARAALEDEARRVGARLLDATAIATVEDAGATGDGGRRVVVRTPSAEHRLVAGMRGAYQARNMRLAVLAAELLREEQGLAIDDRAIARGAREWRWPGRCELVALPDGREILLDAAHNDEGIAALAAELRSGWPAGAARSESWQVIFGALDDKPAAAMAAAIADGAERVILTRPPSPRGVDPRELQPALAGHASLVAPDAPAALDLALASGSGRIVVCGSIYLAGDVRRELRRRFGVPPPATDPWDLPARDSIDAPVRTLASG
jgi:dihydrofolate synthase/folylpolyglutamate synthase